MNALLNNGKIIYATIFSLFLERLVFSVYIMVSFCMGELWKATHTIAHALHVRAHKTVNNQMYRIYIVFLCHNVAPFMRAQCNVNLNREMIRTTITATESQSLYLLQIFGWNKEQKANTFRGEWKRMDNGAREIG